VKAVVALRNLSLGRTSINCQVGRSFAPYCFYVKPQDFVIVEDIIHSVDSTSGQHPNCSIIVVLGSMGLN